MYLIIDNTKAGEVDFFTFTAETAAWVSSRSYPAKNNYSLLSWLDDFLAGEHLSSQQIQGLAVVVGQGSFTATRIAVTTANVLALAWQVPVAKIMAANPELAVSALARAVMGLYVTADYSGEAHIGGKQTKK
ncbi:MAG: hypothetical protein Q7S66_03740 [bacterium]|nr:hypothetical protein [bacterium]